MKYISGFVIITFLVASCAGRSNSDISGKKSLPIEGTWQLITGTIVANGKTTVTDYTKNLSFIKIINDTHFAFLQHDLTKGKDSLASFSSGGGRYSLKDSLYTEHLEYCSAREWEGNDFSFTITMKNDTLIQKGVEKVESAGVNQVNIEKYIRLKN
jgi:hypothetical protein